MIKSIKHYKENVLTRDLLLKQKSVNVMEVPTFEKVSLSLSKKEALINSNKLFIPLLLLKLISGQKPSIAKSKKSVAQFKLREGKAIGGQVTLRNGALYSFLDKFVYVILPQLIEDKNKKFKVNKSTVNFGIEDISIFPELESQYELLRTSQGLNITIDTKNKNRKMPYFLFNGLKIPVQKKKGI